MKLYLQRVVEVQTVALSIIKVVGPFNTVAVHQGHAHDSVRHRLLILANTLKIKVFEGPFTLAIFAAMSSAILRI